MNHWDWLEYKAKHLGVPPIACANGRQKLEINNALEKIKKESEKNAALDWWMGKPKCADCGCEIDRGDNYCSRCGSKQ